MKRGIRLLAGGGILLAALAIWNSVGAAPPDGIWKITLNDRDALIHLALVKVASKDGKAEVALTVPGVPILKDAKVEGATLAKGTLTFTLVNGPREFKVVAQVPENDKEPKHLKGVVLIGDKAVMPAVLQRSTEKEIENFLQESDELKTLQRAEAKDQARRYKELEDKFPDSPILVAGARAMLLKSLVDKADDALLREHVSRLQNLAKSFGPQLNDPTNLEIAKALVSKGRLGDVALPVIQALEKKLPADAPVGQAIPVKELLVAALKAAGKNDEAAKLQGEVDKINAKLDEDFEKENIAFKVDPFAGRKGKSSRVTLVELFTGAECPPCVAADAAFDAAIQAFKPTDAVFLEYHLHIPRPDALTNAASEARQEYYDEAIRGTPTFILNGGKGPGIGGPRQAAERGFKALSEEITKTLEEEATAKLALNVKKDGDKITVEAKADVEKANDKLRLRLVLVEDVVRYAGGNRQRLHHHVVRDLPGGVAGLAVKEKSTTQKVTFSVAEVREKLTKYMTDFAETRGFPTTARPVDLKKLKIVAFLQDDDSKEVLQAAQADVP